MKVDYVLLYMQCGRDAYTYVYNTAPARCLAQHRECRVSGPARRGGEAYSGPAPLTEELPQK